MKTLIKNFQSVSEPFISLHDRRITKIQCTENSVFLMFDEGFDLIEHGTMTRVSPGYAEITGCAPDDFSCYVIKRRATKKGAVLKGIPVSLEELGNMISANHSLEIFTVTYDSCLIHFRGAFFPYEGRSLSTLGVIETNTFSEIRYCWE